MVIYVVLLYEGIEMGKVCRNNTKKYVEKQLQTIVYKAFIKEI